MGTLFELPPIRTTQPASTQTQHTGTGWETIIPDGKLVYFPAFIPAPKADEWLAMLMETEDNEANLTRAMQEAPNQIAWRNVEWQQTPIRIMGREIMQPRLTAWYGNPEATYTYSGKTHIPLPWTPFLQEIKQKVEAATCLPFNSVLMNAYRNGTDSMGWHADNEPELGPRPQIASLNLGQARRFILRKNSDHDFKVEYRLGHGDLLVMAGDLQKHWQHAVPKEKGANGLRVNFTFRQIQPKTNHNPPSI